MKTRKEPLSIDQFASNGELATLLKLRKLPDIKETFAKGSPQINELLGKGWELEVELKTRVRLSIEKKNHIEFEDKVWCLFAMLGFTQMNRDRYYELQVDKIDPSQTEKFEVLARDEETLILVKCFSAETNTIRSLKAEIELLKSRLPYIRPLVSRLFLGKKPKVAMLFATRNIGIAKEDSDQLAGINAIHFPEETVDYYQNLHREIGLSARYQLLGGLFAGQEIPDLDNEIPAIQGKMGGHTYYSFSIEPEKLLKIGYVLHRNKAHSEMMPAYQRLIKKKRLQEIHRFIDEEKGYFPNSIIINLIINEKKRNIFEPSGNQVQGSISKIGILHLPKKYRSAFIIDGQHRLFGYSNSQYKSSNTIPVVALVNLEKSEQVRLFMQINENQKSVGKDLQNTLNAELLWNSEKLHERLTALMSRIAINLGENRLSPFFDKISIGEDKKAISTEQVIMALRRTNFFGKIRKNEIESNGSFFFGDFDRSFVEISDFLFRTFGYLREKLADKWEAADNLVVSNRGFYGIVLSLNDIVNHLSDSQLIGANPRPSTVFERSKPFVDTLAMFFLNMDEKMTSTLRPAFGSGANPKFHRFLQVALRSSHSEMKFDGLDEYLMKEEKENNEQAFSLTREIEDLYLKKFIRRKLEAEFGKQWLKKGLPAKVYSEIHTLATEKNRLIENEDDEVDPYDQLHLIDYREIVKQNWVIFESHFTRPMEKKIQGKENRTKWMEKLNSIRNDVSHNRYVDSDSLSFLMEIKNWLSEREE